MSLRRLLVRIGLAWAAADLAAVVLLLAIFVAFGPVVVLAWSEKTLGYVPGWAVLVVTLSTSLPLAVILGLSARELPARLVRRAKR